MLPGQEQALIAIVRSTFGYASVQALFAVYAARDDDAAERTYLGFPGPLRAGRLLARYLRFNALFLYYLVRDAITPPHA
jgi:hypothetical protein